MTSPRTYRTLGGVCPRGHLLTPLTAYQEHYPAKYRHHNRPPQPYIKCAICHIDASVRYKRERLGQSPRKRIDPDAPYTCGGCGTTMIRRQFGIRGHNKDGTIAWHSKCGKCRGRRSNERAKARRTEAREQEREERQTLTRWVIDQAWRLKREAGVPVTLTRERLGVPLHTWSCWKRAAQLPEMKRLREVVETMRMMVIAEGLG
jgi:hypothetical protein